MALTGKTIILREIRPDDIPHMTALRNDLDTQAWSRALPPDFTDEMIRKQIEGREFSYDPDMARFAIEHKATGQFAGYVSYSNLERRFAATYGIMIDKAFWGKGVALEAQEMLLHFLFMELGVRVVRLWTHSGNPRMIGLAQKSGFQIAFRQRESIFKDGKLLDNVSMDILREEYFARHPELADTLPGI